MLIIGLLVLGVSGAGAQSYRVGYKIEASIAADKYDRGDATSLPVGKHQCLHADAFDSDVAGSDAVGYLVGIPVLNASTYRYHHVI